jgi:hypothetical protein
MCCHKCFSLTPLKGGGGGSENYLREFSDRVREFYAGKTNAKKKFFLLLMRLCVCIYTL